MVLDQQFELVVIKGGTLESVEFKSTIRTNVLPIIGSEVYIKALGRNVVVKRIVYISALDNSVYDDITVYCE